jgi:hypothetical protein
MIGSREEFRIDVFRRGKVDKQYIQETKCWDFYPVQLK